MTLEQIVKERNEAWNEAVNASAKIASNAAKIASNAIYNGEYYARTPDAQDAMARHIQKQILALLR